MNTLLLQLNIYKAVFFLILFCFFGTSYAETFDWNKQDEKGRSLLHYIYAGSVWNDKPDEDKVRLLKKGFEAGEINPNLKDLYGHTAAHYAMDLVFYGQHYNSEGKLTYKFSLDFFKVLITQPSFDPNVREYVREYTPLIRLIMSNSAASIYSVFNREKYPRFIEIFEYFATHEDLDLNYKTKTYFTFSDYIETINYENIPHFKALVKSKSLTLSSPDNYNFNESYRLWYRINTMDSGLELVDSINFKNHISSYKKYLKERFDNGAGTEYSDNSFTALNILATSASRYYGANEESNDKLRTQLGQVLISKGADINTIDGQGRTPLYHALFGRNIFFVSMLLAQSELDLNAQDWEGNTPIMSFIKYYWREDDFGKMMNLLYSRKNDMDLTLKNYKGESALDIIKRVTNDRNREIFEKWVEM